MKKIVLLNLFIAIFALVNAQDTIDNPLRDSSKSITFEASYLGDLCSNVKGGIKRGVGYLGMANLKFGFNTESANLWKGGNFFINGAATHGDTPSSKYIGDFQVASNIEAGNHIYLHEFWYKQAFSKFEFTVGLQDLNVDYIASENGGLFLNSSFGIPALISSNIPVPIFPLTNLGISTKVNINNAFALQAALFDGCPTDFTKNTYNTNWDLNSKDGAFVITELQFTTSLKKLVGNYKAGYYYHTGHVQLDENGVEDEVFKQNYGLYAIADQQIWQRSSSSKSMSIFGQFALSPKHINNLHYYFGGGLIFTGLINRIDNTLGLAVAHSRFHTPTVLNETAIELFYKMQITQNISIQPDFQYIINPMGLEQKLDNALVAIMRVGLNF
ncbi:MAG: carbohydrate porin [Bacteroidales bacterium]|nr:MAG: carbohydrate porin [Bacteroidales bacterium]